MKLRLSMGILTALILCSCAKEEKIADTGTDYPPLFNKFCVETLSIEELDNLVTILVDKGFSDKEIENLQKDLEKHKNCIIGHPLFRGIYEFECSEADDVWYTKEQCTVDFPASVYSHGRIRGDRVLDSCHGSNIVYLTKQDVCVPYKGRPEWGVLGYAYLGKGKCIVSTYRLKNKKDLWKLVAHEYNHSQGLPHCTSGDIHCIMQDAKGHPKFHQEYRLCDECKDKLK